MFEIGTEGWSERFLDRSLGIRHDVVKCNFNRNEQINAMVLDDGENPEN